MERNNSNNVSPSNHVRTPSPQPITSPLASRIPPPPPVKAPSPDPVRVTSPRPQQPDCVAITIECEPTAPPLSKDQAESGVIYQPPMRFMYDDHQDSSSDAYTVPDLDLPLIGPKPVSLLFIGSYAVLYD